MKSTALDQALDCAVDAARATGALMRRNLGEHKRINSEVQHDIKLELDVRCQQLIEGRLAKAFPHVPVLGEEGTTGAPEAPQRWVVDPIDGTVNFTYGIPHACVSIAFQERGASHASRTGAKKEYATLLGVVYDPFCDEMWTATHRAPARLNGRVIRVSRRRKLAEAIVSLGFAKDRESLDRMLPSFNLLVPRVRKMRMMGAAALGLVYVATGRFDAYLEYGLRLWDIAAGGLIVERAGGEFWHRAIPGDQAYAVVANNGNLRSKLARAGRLNLTN